MATIITYKENPDALSQVAEPVPQNDKVRALVESMFTAMNYPDGIGLAAPQIGVNKRIIVYQVPLLDSSGRTIAVRKGTIINPQIKWVKGALELIYEGCLSFPGEHVAVPRHPRVRVDGFDVAWRPVSIVAKDLFAYVLQHEINHLNGITLATYEALAKQAFKEQDEQATGSESQSQSHEDNS